MYDISLLVGLKNNLAYTKYFYTTTRKLYPSVEIVFVSYGSTDGTHEWLRDLADENVISFFSDKQKTLSDTYNKCIVLASKSKVVFLHNDMVIGDHFVENIMENLSEKILLFYTLIEPPVFPDDKRDWKIIYDFGTELSDFSYDNFMQFVSTYKSGPSKLTNETSFFFAAKRSMLKEMGGFDPLFNPMFREDDDIILRCKLNDVQFWLAPNAIVYHFVSKTSRFSDEFKNRTRAIEENSDRNFYRKWGFGNTSAVQQKRDIGLILSNSTLSILSQLEPLVSNLYSNDPYIQSYIQSEQPNTRISLADKIKPLQEDYTNDVLVSFKGDLLTEKQLHIFRNLSEKINSFINKPMTKIFNRKKFTIENISFFIKNNRTLEKALIINKNENSIF